MNKSHVLCVLHLLVFLICISCSSGKADVLIPGTEEPSPKAGLSGRTTSLGLWQFIADGTTDDVMLIQLRGADKILNVLGFMEPPPLKYLDLDWPNLEIDFENGTAHVGVKLTHPFGHDSLFTGFDVRGVVFGPRVTNADGLTVIPSPEYFKGVPFGYQDGLLGAPDSIADYGGLAGYKYFCDGLEADDDMTSFFANPSNLTDRGKFSGTSPHQRNYDLDWNGSGYNILVFNYAVYANYDWPSGDTPYDLDDFSITTANSSEAFHCSVTEIENTLRYPPDPDSGVLSLQVEVWDWQNNIASVEVKSLVPGVIGPVTATSSLPGTTPYSRIFEFPAMPGAATASGRMYILITVTDPETVGESWFMDLLPSTNPLYYNDLQCWWLHSTNVKSEGGWALTWGGNSIEMGNAVIVNDSGEIYVTGSYSSLSLDLDPTSGWDWHACDSGRRAYISKFDSDRNFYWAKSWGDGDGLLSQPVAQGNDLALDDMGNLYVAGYFMGGDIDFDPGPGTDYHTTHGNRDAFIAKYDPSGAFQWARTWGDYNWDEALDTFVDGMGNIYVSGFFRETVDFDPGPGTEFRTAIGDFDSYLSKFDSYGDFLWVRTWGADIDNTVRPLDVAAYGTDSVYVCGYFTGTVDFNPGADTDNHTSSGTSAYLSKFDSSGIFQWVRTFGQPFGTGYEGAEGMAISNSEEIYLAGTFNGTVDFDPGSGVDVRYTNGWSDAFLSVFDSSGTHQWVRTWGGADWDNAKSVVIGPGGDVFVTGHFYGNDVDFNPSPGFDIHNSNGMSDAFISKFTQSGGFEWAMTWGSTGSEHGCDVGVDPDGNSYSTGDFDSDVVDFDPSAFGIDNHSRVGSDDAFLSKFPPDGYW